MRERLGRLLLRHAAEESAFDDARESFIELRELIERLVQLEQRLGLVVARRRARRRA